MAGRTYNRPCDRSAFEVAIVCALPVEADAITSLFDDLWENEDSYGKADGDTNSYTTGRMGAHNVVLVHMARMGKVSAANASANLRFSFRHIHLCLLVGICGAVPFVEDREVLLGDVVVGTQVVQSDFGRQYPDTFVRKSMSEDALGRPNPEIGAFLASLQTRAAQNSLRGSTRMNLDALYESRNINSLTYPGIHDDRLFEPTYRHKHQRKESCTICAECVSPDDGVCTNSMSLSCAELGCDASKLIPRGRVQMAIDAGSNMLCQPRIHFGAMASGDQVIKSAQHRDRIAEDAKVIAFEMEGAGLWDTMPTIVVKGVCDYADSHKSKAWQGYAATTAAACAKAILRSWRPSMRAQRVEYPGGPPRSSPTRQVFSGHFTAGKNIHTGGTYTAGSMNF